ncbi:MAG: hypothetical protein AAGF11_40505 [Myxococcota bacterium]
MSDANVVVTAHHLPDSEHSEDIVITVVEIIDANCNSDVPLTIVPSHGFPQSLADSLAEVAAL